MKLILEILLSIVLHPVAAVLMLVNLFGRDDVGVGGKIFWTVVGIVGWGIGPIAYATVGGGELF